MDSSALGNNKVNENALNAACTEEESTETGLAELLALNPHSAAHRQCPYPRLP